MRYEMAIGLDTPRQEEGDLAFSAVDERRDPRNLEPGLVSRAENKDFIQGVAWTRPGMQTVGWACELAVCFPLCFTDRNYRFLELFSADVSSIEDMSFRVNHGTTLELYCPTTALWHAIWLSMSGGVPLLTISISGTTTAEWDYQEYDESNANFRIVNDWTFQLYCPGTAGFHTVYLQGGAGAVTFVAEIAPSTPSGTPDANWYARDEQELQLLNNDTDAFHSIYIKMSGGFPVLAIESNGVTEFGIDFDNQVGFGEVFGASVFSDPFGVEGVLVAVRNGIYRIMPNQEVQFIRLPFDEIIDAPCRMIQCFDRVLILRGPERAPLVWNPRQTTDAGIGTAQAITMSASRNGDADNDYGDVTTEIPASPDGVLHNNRVFLIQGKDDLVISDILDYTRYSEATQRFRINSGEDDTLMRILPANQTTLILFKNQSIYVLGNVYGDLSNVVQDVLTSEYGLVGRDAVVTVGRDILFLSEVGVFALSQALDNKLQASSEPLSAPIQPIINRINWEYASGAQMAYHSNRLYLAVPLDGARYNNAILVYNFLNRGWSGTWGGPLVDVVRFFKLNYAGKRELWFVGGTSLDDTALHGAAVLMGKGNKDYAFGTFHGIDDLMITRGYANVTISQKDFRRFLVDHSTWANTYGISFMADGVNEIRSISDKTPDRTKYFVFGKSTYDETNANDDHAAPYREDYSVRLTGNNLLYLGSGIGLNRSQRRQLPLQPRTRAGYFRIKFTSSGGRHGIHGVAVEAQPGRRSMAPYG